MNLEFFGVDVGEFLLATVVLIVGIFAINWYKYNKNKTERKEDLYETGKILRRHLLAPGPNRP